MNFYLKTEIRWIRYCHDVTKCTLEANEEQRVLWFATNDPDAALQHQKFLERKCMNRTYLFVVVLAGRTE